MVELTGMGSVLRGLGVLYWLLAIGAVALALWKGKGRRGKAVWAAVAIGVFGFLPAKAMVEQFQRDSYAKEAWVYFKKKCETEAGEKIYKTFTGVKSVLVVKPLPPATEKDLFDQFWYGDPYSDVTPWDRRAALEASKLADPTAPVSYGQTGRGFDFVETTTPEEKGEGKTIVKYFFPLKATSHSKQAVERPVSRFGISWEDISTPEDRKYWVAGSRLRVVDLTDNSIVAERIGYIIEAGFGSKAGQRRPWLTSRGPKTTCPSISSSDYESRFFILKVLKPE